MTMPPADPSASPGGGPAPANPHPPSSRYARVGVATRLHDGREVRYLLRRFVPPAEAVPAEREHAVVQGDRLDRIAADHIGDPEQAWQVADANGAMDPAALEQPVGRRLRIPGGGA